MTLEQIKQEAREYVEKYYPHEVSSATFSSLFEYLDRAYQAGQEDKKKAARDEGNRAYKIGYEDGEAFGVGKAYAKAFKAGRQEGLRIAAEIARGEKDNENIHGLDAEEAKSWNDSCEYIAVAIEAEADKEAEAIEDRSLDPSESRLNDF